MSWNFSNPPAGWPIPNSNNFIGGTPYLIWHIDESVVINLDSSPEKWELRDWQGEILDSGANTGTTLNLGRLPAGHYRVYFSSDTSISTWRHSRGELNIAVWRRKAGMPDRPPVYYGSGDFSFAVPPWGSMNAFPLRFTIHAAEDPVAHHPLSIAGIKADRELHESHYHAYPDPVRLPKEDVIHFRGGSQLPGADVGIGQVVGEFGTERLWYECRNEPDTSGEYGGAVEFVSELADFYNYVKSANPNAKVLGPNPVSIQSLSWINTFLSAGGGQYLDGFSFHSYNTMEGELERGREVAAAFKATLERYGQADKPLWQTEWGTFSATYGSYTPMRHVRKTLLELMLWEQYGVPKERFILFYGKSHGFWDYPSFIFSDGRGILPTATALRVYSEELFGHTFVERLNFGNEDSEFIGSRFEAPSGTSVVSLASCGRIGDPMAFAVTGATELTCVDTMGTETTIPVVNGKITLNLPGTPTYLRVPAGGSLTPLPRVLGKNLVVTASQSQSVSSTGARQAYRVALGRFWRWHDYRRDGPIPMTITVDFDRPVTFDTVDVRGTMPWQVRAAILDASVEAYENDEWVNIGEIHNDYIALEHRSSKWDVACWSETYYDERWNWLIDINRQVTASALRLVIHECTLGGEFEHVNTLVDGQGLAPEDKGIAMQSIRVYNVMQANKRQIVTKRFSSD